jgi:hypothetical protein
MSADAEIQEVAGSAPAASVIAPDGRPRPASVAIVAMGASHGDFIHGAAFAGGSNAIAEEVWAINAMAGVIRHDRAFLMDPPRHILDLPNKPPAYPIYAEWLQRHPGPVYSTETDPRCPGVVEYPLEEVLNAHGFVYMNTTVAYAIAYASWIEVPQIKLFGCDFTYPDVHIAESGRACAEFWMAVAIAKGLRVQVCPTSTLFDSCVPYDRRLYAYERAGRRPVVTPGEDGRRFRVEWVSNETGGEAGE